MTVEMIFGRGWNLFIDGKEPEGDWSIDTPINEVNTSFDVSSVDGGPVRCAGLEIVGMVFDFDPDRYCEGEGWEAPGSITFVMKEGPSLNFNIVERKVGPATVNGHEIDEIQLYVKAEKVG